MSINNLHEMLSLVFFNKLFSENLQESKQISSLPLANWSFYCFVWNPSRAVGKNIRYFVAGKLKSFRHWDKSGFLSPFDTLLCFKLFFECNLGQLLLSKVAANCKFIDHQLYLTNFKLQFGILVTDACLDTLVHRAGLGFI